MIALRAALAVAVALGVQIVLGLWAPSLTRWLDVLMLPVAWYALAVSQRSGLFVGCAAGLLQDAWLQAELFGGSGFSKSRRNLLSPAATSKLMPVVVPPHGCGSHQASVPMKAAPFTNT